jgi:hypothetical protein
VRTTARFDQPHQREDVGIERRVTQVVVDVQGVDVASTSADVSVAEVPPEQLRIGHRVERSIIAPGASSLQVRLTTR